METTPDHDEPLLSLADLSDEQLLDLFDLDEPTTNDRLLASSGIKKRLRGALLRERGFFPNTVDDEVLRIMRHAFEHTAIVEDDPSNEAMDENVEILAHPVGPVVTRNKAVIIALLALLGGGIVGYGYGVRSSPVDQSPGSSKEVAPPKQAPASVPNNRLM